VLFVLCFVRLDGAWESGGMSVSGLVLIDRYVTIHALASMPSASRLSEADSKTSTGVPCL
jgi:hypothetical protein